MSTILSIAGLSVAGAVLASLAVWFRRVRRTDLGVMGDQWLAEQRLVKGGDPNR